MANTKLKKSASYSSHVYKKYLKIAAIIVLIAIVVAIFVSMFSGKANPDAVKDQLAAISAGDLNQAYHLTSKSFQQRTSFEDFKSFVEYSPLLKTNKAVNFVSRKREGRSEFLKGVIEANNGGKIEIDYQLINEDNVWKIQSISLSPVSSH